MNTVFKRIYYNIRKLKHNYFNKHHKKLSKIIRNENEIIINIKTLKLNLFLWSIVIPNKIKIGSKETLSIMLGFLVKSKLGISD